MVGHGVDLADAPGLRREQRPRHRRPARRHARRRTPPAGAGRLDGRLRRGPLRLPRARPRAARAAHAGRPRRGTVRAAVPPLRPRPGPRARRRGRAVRPAQHLRRHQGSPRSTWSRRGRGRPGDGVVAALPQRLRAADAARHPVRRASRRSSGRRWSGARRRGSWRTAASAATSCTSRDVAAANVLALTTDPPAGGLTAVNVCSGEPHTIGDLAGALAAATRGPEPVVVGGARPGDVRHVVADPARAAVAARASGPRCASPRACAPSPPIRCALRPGPPTSPNGKRPEARPRGRHARRSWRGRRSEIILPCLDEADALPVVLAALPAGWPVLVVDNGSTDGTAAVARALGARVVAEPRRGLRRRRARRAGGGRRPSWSRCSTGTARSIPRCCRAWPPRSPRARPTSRVGRRVPQGPGRGRGTPAPATP